MSHPDFIMTPAQNAQVADWLERIAKVQAEATHCTTRLDTHRARILRNARPNDRRLFAMFLADWKAGIDAEIASQERMVAWQTAKDIAARHPIIGEAA